jgi:hypothetical protein
MANSEETLIMQADMLVDGWAGISFFPGLALAERRFCTHCRKKHFDNAIEASRLTRSNLDIVSVLVWWSSFDWLSPAQLINVFQFV